MSVEIDAADSCSSRRCCYEIALSIKCHSFVYTYHSLINIYIYTHMEREREREQDWSGCMYTIGVHGSAVTWGWLVLGVV